MFLANSFLQIGAWTDITKDMPNQYLQDASALRAATCVTGYSDGQVWEGFRKDWVYETDINYVDLDGSGHAPLDPAVYVNGGVVPSGYSVDYPNGRVIFDNPVSLSSTVQGEYSFKNVQTYIGDDVPWWRELQFLSWDVDAEFFQQSECGDWIVGGHHRVQMPAVIISSIPGGSLRPWGLGTGCTFREQSLNIHILAETKHDRDKLLDIILMQLNNCHGMFDYDEVNISGDFPLDCNGFLVGDKSYYELLQDYPLTTSRIDEAEITGMSTLHCGLFEGVVTTRVSFYWCT
jgi:hypothetical protein